MWWFKKKQPESNPTSNPTLQEQLVEAKANLARAEQLPDSAFTGPGSNPLALKHGIDEKPKRIAVLKAEIAYLEVKVAAQEPTNSTKQETNQ